MEQEWQKTSHWPSGDEWRVIFFIDHGGVLASAIKGTSKEKTWRELLLSKLILAGRALDGLAESLLRAT